MANQQGNGRNVAMPDENRPSWRPQDDSVTARSRRNMDDEYDMRDRYWADRRDRWDRDDDDRSMERYGQGQSGYGAGRYEDDRSMRWQSRNQGYPGSFEERMRDRGVDERFQSGRGGGSWGYNPERYGAQGGYGAGRGFEDRGGYGHEGERIGERGGGYLAQGGQEMGRDDRYEVGQRSRYGGRGMQGQGGLYGQGGHNEGMYGHGGMQHRYGSQGYQGYGSHRGKGPASYVRSDERIREQICEMLTDDDRIDATNIDITVKNGEVTLAGTVEDRHMKRLAEDCVENLSGVKDVTNQIRVGDKKTSGKENESATPEKRHRA